MAVTKNFSWTLSGSGWAINYDATVTVSVSRAYGSDIARVTCTGSMHTPVGNGDSNAKWIFQLKCGSSTWNKTISSGYHAPDRRDSFTYTFDVSVGATGGTLSGRVDFQAYDNNNGFGAWAGEQTWSQDYGSKGYSTIASASNVTLNTSGTATSTVTFTSYSSSFTHKVKATLGSASTSEVTVSGGNSVSKTATLTFPATFINQITNAKTGTATVTLTTYSGSTSIGSSTKNITLTVPSGINPSVSIATAKVSALQSTYFANKFCTLIDKLKVTLTETTQYSSAIASRSISANGESFTVSPATTTNPLSTVGANTVTASVTDGRGNSGSNTATVNVYWYFYPTVSVKYRHASDYYLDLSGRIAYVGGDQTTKTLRLAIYKGSTLVVSDLNLDSYIASSPSGGTYDGYLEISGSYPIPSEYIPDIETETYTFTLTVTDTVSSSTASAYSGIAVMTFGAGGTSITAHKPVTFEQGINGNVEAIGFLQGASYRNANGDTVYPPTTTDGSIANGNTGNATSYWKVLKYNDLSKMIISIMSVSLTMPNTYGSGYYDNVTMMLPTSFFSDGSGNPHFIVQVNTHRGSGGGIFSTNVHTMNTATGALGIFIGNWYRANITAELVVYGFKF